MVTYEFLKRNHRTNDLAADEILMGRDRLGECDLVLLKGSHYWQGPFDDSSWGYPRFRSLAERLMSKLHARGIKTGIFGFTDRQRSYGEGPDHRRIMEVWREYVRLAEVAHLGGNLRLARDLPDHACLIDTVGERLLAVHVGASLCRRDP